MHFHWFTQVTITNDHIKLMDGFIPTYSLLGAFFSCNPRNSKTDCFYVVRTKNQRWISKNDDQNHLPFDGNGIKGR